ncbi:uncharacterized protein [Drosophila takahashii]|uniref:uncharacterized protein n=1 Tax=Drosophila takahashii TaxID=29030 RepID=UPI0038995F14
MSLKFNEALEVLVENLSKTIKPEQQRYMQDVDEITKKIDQELININSIFKGTITKWDQTFMFCDKPFSKTRVPILWIDLPFAVEPQKVFVHDDPRCRMFNLKTVVNHPAVQNGFVIGKQLISLFSFDLNRAIDRMHIFTCKSGKKYNISSNFDKPNNPICKIDVKEYSAHGLEENMLLFYEFHIMFNFSNDNFFYAYMNNFFHQVEKSKVEASGKKANKLLTNAKKLLIQLQVVDKSLMVPAVNFVLDCTVDLSTVSNTGDTLLSAIKPLIPLTGTPGTLIYVLGKLLQFKESDSVKLPELMELFGLQK